MLVFADHALRDLRRWWRQTGEGQAEDPQFYEVFEFVLEVAAVGQASWSLLSETGNGNRAISVDLGLVPLVIQLRETGQDLVVTGILFPEGE